MLGTSTAELVFIRICIFGLRAITPIALSYVAVVFIVRPSLPRAPLPLEIYVLLEAGFYLLVYLPRSIYLQREATHPQLPSREERRILFDRVASNIPDPEHYVRGWFLGSPLSEIKRDNVREFLQWAFLNSRPEELKDGQELDQYIDSTEKLLGRKFEPGRGDAVCLRLTIDKVNMMHRPLIWYGVSHCREDVQWQWS